jgi:hypothetical protein
MKIEFTLVQERATKNSVVYSATDGAPVTTVYVLKSQLTQEGQRGYPESIKVTFEF